MAKKIQRKAKSASKRSSGKRSISHPFMASRQSDLFAFLSVAGKGPHKDQTGARLVASSVRPDLVKPSSR